MSFSPPASANVSHSSEGHSAGCKIGVTTEEKIFNLANLLRQAWQGKALESGQESLSWMVLIDTLVKVHIGH